MPISAARRPDRSGSARAESAWAGRPPATTLAPPGLFRERRFTAQDGLGLYYRDYGSEYSPLTPVLCLAGLTRNSKDFHELAVRLSAARRVLCLDYRGRGRSDYDRDWRHYVPRTYAEDVRHLLAATGIAEAVFIGTSLGGLVTMAMAALAPGLIRGAVLNDIGPHIETSGLGRIFAYIRGLRPLPDWDAAARELKRAFPPLSLSGEADWLEFARATFREGSDGLLYPDWDMNILKPFTRPQPAVDLWALFGALAHVPVMVVRGGVSDVLSETTLKTMQERRPDLATVTVPGVGHTPSLREPPVTAALDRFLERF